ncbi:MAG: hypothetical protein R3E66_11535 [bacterium]
MVEIKDALKRKQLTKGLDQLSEEGAIQVFRQPTGRQRRRRRRRRYAGPSLAVPSAQRIQR